MKLSMKLKMVVAGFASSLITVWIALEQVVA